MVFGHLDGDCISAALKVVFLDVSDIWVSRIRRVTVISAAIKVVFGRFRYLGIWNSDGDCISATHGHLLPAFWN